MDGCDFVFRHELGAEVVNAHLECDGLCGSVAVAGEHDQRLETLPAEQVQGVAARGARPIRDCNDADRLAGARHEDRRSSFGTEVIELRVDRARAEIPLFEQPVIPDHNLHALDAAFGAASGERDYVAAWGHGDPRHFGVVQDSLRDRVLGALLDRGGECDDRRRRDAVHGEHVNDLRRATSERARLVERDAAHAAGTLQVGAAFDQHALTRGAGERRDD